MYCFNAHNIINVRSLCWWSFVFMQQTLNPISKRHFKEDNYEVLLRPKPWTFRGCFYAISQCWHIMVYLDLPIYRPKGQWSHIMGDMLIQANRSVFCIPVVRTLGKDSPESIDQHASCLLWLLAGWDRANLLLHLRLILYELGAC